MEETVRNVESALLNSSGQTVTSSSAATVDELHNYASPYEKLNKAVAEVDLQIRSTASIRKNSTSKCALLLARRCRLQLTYNQKLTVHPAGLVGKSYKLPDKKVDALKCVEKVNMLLTEIAQDSAYLDSQLVEIKRARELLQYRMNSKLDKLFFTAHHVDVQSSV